MNGPMTLHAQPHYDRWYDAAGEHDMSWLTTRGNNHVVVDPIGVADAEARPVALSTQVGSNAAFKNLVPQSNLKTFNEAPTWLTVTNGTKTYAYLTTIIPPNSEDGFLMTPQSGVGGASSYVGVPLVAKVTATGPNLKVTITLPVGGSGQDNCFIVGNVSTEPRTAWMVDNDARDIYVLPITIPAKTVALLTGSSYEATEGSGKIGFEIADSEVGDIYHIYWMGVNERGGEIGAVCIPVPLSNSRASDVFEHQAIAGKPAVTLWAGTTFNSVAMEGERYWRIAVNRDHFPDELEGEIVSRWLPYGWPHFHTAGAINLERGLNYLRPTANPNYRSASLVFLADSPYDWGRPLNMWYVGYWAEYVPGPTGAATIPLVGDMIGTTGQVGQNGGVGQPPLIPMPIPDTPWTEFMLASMRWSEDRVIMSNGDTILVDALRPLALGHDFPFKHVEPTAYGTSDAVYLSATASVVAGGKSVTFTRDVAVFNRNLTDTERAFCADPDSVWSLNMFAEPDGATVVGLTGDHYRGDTVRATVTVVDADGDAIPLHGCKVFLTVKLTDDMTDADDTDALATCSVLVDPDGSGTTENVDSFDADTGEVVFEFNLPFVANTQIGRTGWRETNKKTAARYDVQLIDVNEDVHTVAVGTLSIASDVTRRTE